MHEGDNSWSQYRIQVLSDLKRINKNVEILANNDIEIRIDIGRLKLVAAIWGGVAGSIGTLVIMLTYQAVIS
jgi:hypothetical protein